MDDLISRTAAIDALDKVAEMFPYKIPGKANTYRQYNEAWSDAIDAAENALEALPSAQLAQDLTNGCTDTISRAAVVDAIEGVDWYHQNKDGEMVHGANSDEHQAWYKADDIYKAIEALPSAQPGQRNARVFQGIVVEYPSISAYPEYEGKPYFSIKYTENGQEFIGYGTYKPEVLSEYLKEYFMPPTQPTLYGYDLRNLIVFADAVRKKEITESEIEDFVRNARAAWNYAWEEFLRVQKEVLKQTLKKPCEGGQNGTDQN